MRKTKACFLFFALLLLPLMAHSFIIPDYSYRDNMRIAYLRPEIRLVINKSLISGTYTIKLRYNRLKGELSIPQEAAFFLFLNRNAALTGAKAKTGEQELNAFFINRQDARETYTRNVEKEKRKRRPKDPLLVEDLGQGVYLIHLYPVTETNASVTVNWKEFLPETGYSFPFETAAHLGIKPQKPLFTVQGPNSLQFNTGTWKQVLSSDGVRQFTGEDILIDGKTLFRIDNQGQISDKKDALQESPAGQKKAFAQFQEKYRNNPGISWDVFTEKAGTLPFVNPLRSLLALEKNMRIYRKKETDLESYGYRPGVSGALLDDGFGGRNSVITVNSMVPNKVFSANKKLPGRVNRQVRQELEAFTKALQSRKTGRILHQIQKWYLYYSPTPSSLHKDWPKAKRNHSYFGYLVKKEFIHTATRGVSLHYWHKLFASINLWRYGQTPFRVFLYNLRNNN